MKTPDVAAEVGAEIRALRKARGLTLLDVAQRVDCSQAYLSRIERGDARVSVDLLAQIGNALEVDARWFFPERSGTGPLERAHIVRASARRPLSAMYTRSIDELGFEDELLSSTLAGGFYLLMSRFPAGRGRRPKTAQGYVFEGEQHGVVVLGEVLLLLGDERIVLRKGDSFSFASTNAHRFFNNTDKEAVMVWAMAPVRISW